MGYVAVAVCAVGFGLLLTHVLVHGWLGQFDTNVSEWFAARRDPVLDALSLVGSNFAGQVTVPLISLVGIVVFAMRREWMLVGVFALAPALEGLVYLTTTYFVTRSRPSVVPLEELIRSDSYYSGHTASAVALYGTIAIGVFALTCRHAIRTAAIVVAALAPIIVAVSRVYRGMHYPSDTLAGAVVGLACLTVAVVAVRAGARSHADVRGAR
jgi:membrane-associated phospholipid phosphatase